MSLSESMKDLVLNNITLKILALVFAVVLWFFVVGERGTEIGFLVPLELKRIPEGFVITNEVKNFVEVRLSGPRTLLTSLSPGEMRISIDLSHAKKGRNTFRILPDHIQVPRGIKVTGVRPESITIVLERLVTVKVPVRPEVVGTLPKGFRMKEVVVSPQEVSITGIEKDLKGIREIKTVPVRIGGITESLVRRVSLDLTHLNVTRVDPDTVEVSINIQKVGGEDGE